MLIDRVFGEYLDVCLIRLFIVSHHFCIKRSGSKELPGIPPLSSGGSDGYKPEYSLVESLLELMKSEVGLSISCVFNDLTFGLLVWWRLLYS